MVRVPGPSYGTVQPLMYGTVRSPRHRQRPRCTPAHPHVSVPWKNGTTSRNARQVCAPPRPGTAQAVRAPRVLPSPGASHLVCASSILPLRSLILLPPHHANAYKPPPSGGDTAGYHTGMGTWLRRCFLQWSWSRIGSGEGQACFTMGVIYRRRV